MKAALVNQPGGTFDIAEIEIDAPLGREVLVDVKATGLCHSDLHLAVDPSYFPLPVLFGHEAAGIVRSVGPDAVGFEVGDHVVASMISHCGACGDCLAGRTYLCQHADAVRRPYDAPPRLRQGDAPVFQGLDIGGFAEQILVHENNLVRVPKAVPFDRACLLGCGVITGAGAVINTAGVTVGDTVAVVGVGGVGLNVIQAARLAGASQVIAVDTQPAKAVLATKFGATHFVDASAESAVKKVREISGDGVNAAFEVVGLVPTAKQALEMARVGGTAYLIGVQRPGSILDLEPYSSGLAGDSKGIRGVYMGSSNFKRDVPLFADLYLQGRYNLDDLVSQSIPLEGINEAYEQLAGGQIARSIVVFD